MIVGIGIDSVEIDRVKHWSNWPKTRLSRLFCDHEITYACSKKYKQAERLAARFAAREALYKALTPITSHPVPFLSLCSYVCIQNNPAPQLILDWSQLIKFLTINPKNIACHLSITHTKTVATAFIVLDMMTDFVSNQKKV